MAVGRQEKLHEWQDIGPSTGNGVCMFIKHSPARLTGKANGQG